MLALVEYQLSIQTASRSKVCSSCSQVSSSAQIDFDEWRIDFSRRPSSIEKCCKNSVWHNRMWLFLLTAASDPTVCCAFGALYGIRTWTGRTV